MASIKAAVQAAPSDVPLRRHLAALLAEQGEIDEAVHHAAAALHAAPSDVEARRIMRELLDRAAPAGASNGAPGAAPAPAGCAGGLGTHVPLTLRPQIAERAEPVTGALPWERPGRAPAAPTAAPTPEPAPKPVPPAAAPTPAAAELAPTEAFASVPAPDAPVTAAPEQAAAPQQPYAPAAPEAESDQEPADESPDLFWDLERVDVTLADVEGMAMAKESLEAAVLAPMRNPELRRLHRESLDGGVLLYGPPGCGKTFLARALAGELGARFVHVALADLVQATSAADAQDLVAVFEVARREQPVLIYLDDLDVLSRRRMSTARAARAVDQIVSELDRGLPPGVHALAAAGAPWDVHSILRRGGRFARSLLVMPPDQQAREVILRQELARLGGPSAQSVPVADIALLSDGLSGTDLTRVVEVALEAAQGAERALIEADLRLALLEVPGTTGAWLDRARSAAQLEPDESVYAGLREYLRVSQRW